MRNMIKSFAFAVCATTLLAACDASETATQDKAPAALTAQPVASDAAPTQTQQVPDAHTAATSLDWVGTYRGVLPCADCEGIETTITLKDNNNYTLETRYMGKGDDAVNTESGTFAWGKDGTRIMLGGSTPLRFQVAENKLFHLDLEGNRIEGSLADHYILVKQMEKGDHGNAITERYWKLVELRGEKIGKTMRDAHFILKAHEPRVQGSGGCNGMGGHYELKDENGIRFGQMISTMMACPDGMDVEHAFLTSLEEVETYDVQGDVLILKDKTGDVVSRFEAVYLQ